MKGRVDHEMQVALENLRGLIVDGEVLDQAIRIISQESGFSTEALAKRARAAFGDLDTLYERHEREAVPIREQALVNAVIKKAIAKYVALGTREHTISWLTNEIGRTPSEDEIDRAFWGAVNLALSEQRCFLD